MNILMLASWYPNEIDPTNGNFIEKHCEAIALNNHVTLIYFEPNPYIEKSYIRENEINHVKRVGLIYPKVKSRIPIVSLFIKMYRQYRLIQCIRKQLNWKAIDCIHLHVCLPYGLWAYWLAKKQKKPFVVSEHSSAFHQQKMSKFDHLIVGKIFNQAQKISTVSSDLGKTIQQQFHLNENQFFCIPNVVNESYFFVVDRSSTNKTHQFLHISNAVEKAKNILGILEAIQLLSQERTDFQLTIVSDGNTEYLHDFIQKNNLRHLVAIESTKSTVEIATIIQEADTLVLFSNYENFPCVIAEAWMCGVPVISTAVNGIPEFANDENSILIQKGNIHELKDALVNRIEQRSPFHKSAIAKEAVHQFSYKAVNEQFNALYHSLK